MKRLILVAVIPALILSGCLVASFHPFYKETDLVTNDELLGNWIGKKSLLTFERQNGSGYLVNYKDCEDPYNAPEDYSTCTAADFTVHLMKLGDEHFMDFYPRAYMNTDNLFLNLHIRPTHSFAKVIIKKEAIQIMMFDYGWLMNYLNNKGKLAHIRSDDLVTLTASTEELQAFVLTHQKEPGFFSEPVTLVRRK